MGKLDKKIALVTGAASKRGIGHAVAVRLAQEGAQVAVNDISAYGSRGASENDRIENWHGLASVVSEIERMGQHAFAVEADVSSAEQVKTMISSVVNKFGTIDILVNNAGINTPQNKKVVEITDEQWIRVIDINLLGAVRCSREASKIMVDHGKGGKIVNISSFRGKLGTSGWGPYTVSKFGLIGLTQTLASEFAQYSINVNAVCPGFVATEIGLGATIRREMNSGVSLEEATSKAYSGVISQVPLGRAAQPEEVADLVAFLASKESDYITGQAINVCGGFMMSH